MFNLANLGFMIVSLILDNFHLAAFLYGGFDDLTPTT